MTILYILEQARRRYAAEQYYLYTQSAEGKAAAEELDRLRAECAKAEANYLATCARHDAERKAEVRMAAATARAFAADKNHAAACADGLTYGDPVFDAAQAELDAAGAEWDAARAAEFGDYRSAEEMAAHYGKEGHA